MKVIQIGFWMDGGTMTIEAILESKEEVYIEFVQNMIFEISPAGKFPGQLYLNNVHVNLRSQLEKDIIESLKKVSTIENVFSTMEKEILEEKIQYLESNKYLEDYKFHLSNYTKP